MMSSLPKMGSRYSQPFWHLSQLSSTSWIVSSVFSHCRARSSNGPMYGDAFIAIALTTWSSSKI